MLGLGAGVWCNAGRVALCCLAGVEQFGMTWGRLCLLVAVGGALMAPLALGEDKPAGGDAEGIAFFEKKIRPVLVEHCYECHSSRAKELEGGLSVESAAALRKGGDQGPAIVPGDLAQSLLIRAVRYEDGDLQMPPKAALPGEVIADFESWVKRGAPDPRVEKEEEGQKHRGELERAKSRRPFTRPADPKTPAVKLVD